MRRDKSRWGWGLQALRSSSDSTERREFFLRVASVGSRVPSPLRGLQGVGGAVRGLRFAPPPASNLRPFRGGVSSLGLYSGIDLFFGARAYDFRSFFAKSADCLSAKKKARTRHAMFTCFHGNV